MRDVIRELVWRWLLKREFMRHCKTKHYPLDCIFCRLPPAESLDFMSTFFEKANEAGE